MIVHFSLHIAGWLSFALILWFVFPYAYRKCWVLYVKSFCRRKKIIALTFDDGPGTSLTPRILVLLKRYNIQATFFIVGNKAQEAPDVLAKIIASGNEIGSHSFEHINAWFAPPHHVYRDISRGLFVTKALGDCRLFRPPYGKSTLGTMLQIFLNGFKHAWWTIDSTDTKRPPTRVSQVIDRIRMERGGVILIHDHDRPSHSEREDYVVALIEGIVEFARLEGYSIRPLGKLYDI